MSTTTSAGASNVANRNNTGLSPWVAVTSGATNQNSVSTWAHDDMPKHPNTTNKAKFFMIRKIALSSTRRTGGAAQASHTARNTGWSPGAVQRPPLTSGMSTRWFPWATDRSLNTPTKLQSAPS